MPNAQQFNALISHHTDTHTHKWYHVYHIVLYHRAENTVDKQTRKLANRNIARYFLTDSFIWYCCFPGTLQVALGIAAIPEHSANLNPYKPVDETPGTYKSGGGVGGGSGKAAKFARQEQLFFRNRSGLTPFCGISIVTSKQRL